MALIEISDRFARFRLLAMQVWNEGYVPSFTGEEESALPGASECFEEICAYLWGNIVLRFNSIHDVYSPFANNQVPQVEVLFRLREGCELLNGAGGGHQLPPGDVHPFRFDSLFDWGLYERRPFEWIKLRDAESRTWFARISDVTGIYVDDADEK